MMTPKIFESEYRFMLILWNLEPVNSTRLVAACKDELGWSKATTYTVIRRLKERGVLVNENTIVRSLVSQEEVQAAEMDELVQKTFLGSIPQFLTAFTRRKELKQEDIDALRKIIRQYEEP